MNQSLKTFMALSFTSCIFAVINGVAPTYKIRSQSRDKVIQMVGSTNNTHLYGKEDWWGTFAVIPEYGQSFRGSTICNCLFGNSLINTVVSSESIGCIENCNVDCGECTIKIQGSSVTDRDARAWLAEYFYLPTDFDSTLTFEPHIGNFNLNFDLYVGLDHWTEGLYFRAYGPFTHTRWNLDFCERIITEGAADYVAGYFTPNATPNNSLLESFADYAEGKSPIPLTQFANTVTSTNPITTTFNKLQFARITKCAQTANGFADLRAELGWNFWIDEDYHVGLNIQAAAPTGNKIKAKYLFNPQIGNGHHWEVGGGFTTHYVFWRSEDEEKHFGFYLDLNLTHLFASQEERTFDLNGKPMSRYMLAAQMGPNTQGLTGTSAAGLLASNQFAAVYNPVANLTTFDVNVSVNVQADLVAMFNFTSDRFTWDIGYNFWGSSCENINCNESSTCCTDPCKVPSATLCDTTEKNKWVLKGDAQMYGYQLDSDSAFENFAVPLSSSNSFACITRGTANSDSDGIKSTTADTNTSVDNPQGAFTNDASGQLATSRTSGRLISTSIQPLFLDCECINFKGVRGISNKVFTHFAYTWERDNWIPYLGIGASAEFGTHGGKSCTTNVGCGTNGCASTNTIGCCKTNCDEENDSCESCALSQWGIWLKTGVSFN